MPDLLQKYDMNLLRTFVMVYETRSVTGAAELLIISQPSVSFALSKLRKLFADPLFHRGPKGLQPTPLATSLYPELRQAIRTMDSSVRGTSKFDPATTTHRFRLMMTDLGLMALFPYIVRAVQSAAPGSQIEVVPLNSGLLREGLMRSEIDAAIGVPIFDNSDLVRDHLMDMPYVGVCAKSHPRMSEAPTRDEFGAERQVVVANALGHEHVQRRMAELGLRNQAGITLPHFAVVAQTLAVTEHVSVVPRALADIFESLGTIRQFRLPFSIEPGHVALYTYRRAIASPPIEWLRSVIAEALIEYPYPKYVVAEDPD